MFRMLLTMAALTATAPVGEIYGDVRLGEKYLADLPVELKCGAEVVRGTTDKTGSFRLSNKTGGRCDLSVTYDKQTVSIQVVVFERPSHYRLMLEKTGEAYSLKRV